MGQLWAAVAKGKPRKAHGYEISVFSYGKAPGFSLVKIQTKGAESRQKKKKQAQAGLHRQHIEVRDSHDGGRNSPPLKGRREEG